MSLKKDVWLIAALDAIAQFRATKEPLKNVVRRLSTQRHLGAHDRRNMSEAVFGWSRIHASGQSNVMRELKQKGISRPTVRQIDEAIIAKWLQEGGQGKADFPEWFAAKLSKAYGDEAGDLMMSLQHRAGPTLAIDIRHASMDEVCAALDGLGVAYGISDLFKEAIRIVQSPFRIESLPKALQHHVWLMDESSQLAASQVRPKGDEWVLDLCAGGGGKTRFLSTRGAKVVAMDISERRIISARERCEDGAAIFMVADGCHPPFEEGSFDWILLDAPCSGTGTLRRAPDLLLRLKESDIPEFVALQRQLLQSAYRLLKPSGVLIYATCSIFPEENHQQISWAQEGLKFSHLHELQLLPSRDHTDGFYVAALKK